MTFAQAKAEIEAGVTIADTYRRKAEIDRRLRVWAIAQVTPVDTGYERTIISVYLDTGLVEYRDTLIQERLDREAAAQALADYQASLPRLEPTGIEAPVVVLLDVDGTGLGVVAADGELVTYLDHASPRPDATEISARQAAARQGRKDHRARIAAVATDLNQVEVVLDACDLSASGPAGTAIAACSGVTRTALTEIRKAMSDMKLAAKNLRQACEKIRKEIK